MLVGVSINLEMIVANPIYGLTGRALETLILLVALLMVTSLLLVPAQGMVVAGGVEGLVVGLAEWASIVAIQVLQLRNWHYSLEANLRWHLVARVIAGQVSTLALVAAGIAVLSWGVSGLYLLVAGVVLSLLDAG